MSSFIALAVLGLTCLVPKIHAYAIDSSCTDQGFLRESAEAAIEMARAAKRAITPDNGAPRNPDVVRLIDLLFRGPDDPPGILDMRQAEKVFEAIASSPFATFKDNITPGLNPNIGNDVMIFCNLDRVIRRRDGTYVESTTGNIIEDFTQTELDACHTESPDLAATWPVRFQTNGNNPQGGRNFVPSQVTLCPWFYEWARSQALNKWSALKWKSGLATPAIPFSSHVYPFTPIDAINLLDKVLLHEFTHTFAAGSLKDVKMATGGAPIGFFAGVGYGWKAAKNLAKQEGNNLQNGPFRNSDTLALFASGVRLLEEDHPVYIQDNGWTTTTRPSKRDVPVEFQHGRSPAAFDGFLTSIRAERAAATAV